MRNKQQRCFSNALQVISGFLLAAAMLLIITAGIAEGNKVIKVTAATNGKPAPSKTDNPFGDVKADDYFRDAVLWAVEKGITLGTDATHFSPSDTCTRGQVVTFLYRNANK